jgi:alpha-L-rhamnosidase
MATRSNLTRREFLGTAAGILAENAQGRPIGEPAPAQPRNLKCEYAETPLGVDILCPRLSWRLEAAGRAVRQTAYQILVAADLASLQIGRVDFWDSGKVQGSVCSQVEYRGRKLSSRTRCFWKVRIWDGRDRASEWSPVSWWEMGLLDPADWQARWIGAGSYDDWGLTYTGPAAFFRRVIEIAAKPISARAYVCGLGFYELYINGEKVGDHVLSPNQTNYDRRHLRRLDYPFDNRTRERVCYVTYDVTASLREGRNAVGLILGHGWYNQRDRLAEGYMWYGLPRFILQIEATLADGSRRVVVSDDRWKLSTSGPIVHNGIFTGERYDARLEMPGWCLPDYDDSAWTSARLMPAPVGQLTAQYGPPDRVTQTLPPVFQKRRDAETVVFDFGQNLAGWIRLNVRGPHGSAVRMRFIEDGGPSYGQADGYVIGGRGEETWEPRFTWHGFRQVEINSSTETLRHLHCVARVAHSDVKAAGTFTCSNSLFNQILHNCLWSQRSNMHGSVPSDCPHRERVGYTGDWGQVAAEAAIFNFDMARFYTKWIHDMADAQNPKTGFVPHSAPFEGGGGGPPWGSGYVVVPWLMYVYYADRRTLTEHYTGMQHWVEYLRSKTDREGIVVAEEPGSWNLGEWATPAPLEIPPEFVNTCYYAYVAKTMERISKVLGKTGEIAYFSHLADEAGRAVKARFFDAAARQYWTGRQGANVFPLVFGLVDHSYEKPVFERLIEIIMHENTGHFDTGIFGTRFVLDLLTCHGRADIAFTMMNQTTFPSFGWQIERGATTLWENWNGHGSHNHAMFGSVCAWFYKALAGINADAAQPGFKHVIIRPEPVGDLSFAEAKYESLYGEIVSFWRRDSADLHLVTVIPANCTATVFLPTTHEQDIDTGGKPLAEASEIRLLGVRQGRVACQIASGRYEFTVRSFTAPERELPY